MVKFNIIFSTRYQEKFLITQKLTDHPGFYSLSAFWPAKPATLSFFNKFTKKGPFAKRKSLLCFKSGGTYSPTQSPMQY
ncbi:MAG TPA: hypothetical protein P5294_09465, partial [Smithellaceae bacterium]|nr:hypothetical protein [Smithellaceae bacterium]HRS88677.1 hypothetical protein [Smithellaceae bacterium]HRV26757.1 hypothetical protein [Smithellaceae bacterium]